jgi:hypothetical protein
MKDPTLSRMSSEKIKELEALLEKSYPPTKPDPEICFELKGGRAIFYDWATGKYWHWSSPDNNWTQLN